MTTLMNGMIAICVVAGIAGIFAAANPPRPAAPSSGPGALQTRTGYAPVNGLKMYYEIRGEGKPAVFIHPVLGDCGVVPELPRNRQWICMDLQGHGRTADIDRPLTCEQHADDIAALLKYLKIEQADFFGDSFGGTIAVMMAVRHPELVRRVVSHGGSLAPYPGSAADRLPHDSSVVRWQREEYQKVAPHPEHWAVFFDKASASLYAWKGLSPEQLKTINIPVLIAGGDHDLIPFERFAEWSRMIPNAQLSIIPDASHFMLFSEPGRLLPTIAAFLDESGGKPPLSTGQTGYYPGVTR